MLHWVDAQSKVYVRSSFFLLFFIRSKLTNAHVVIQCDALMNLCVAKSEYFRIRAGAHDSTILCMRFKERESHHFIWWCICFCLLTRDAIKIRKIGKIHSKICVPFWSIFSEICCTVKSLAIACPSIGFDRLYISEMMCNIQMGAWCEIKNHRRSEWWCFIKRLLVHNENCRCFQNAHERKYEQWKSPRRVREIRCGMLKWERFNNVHHIHFRSEYILFWTFSP